MGASAGMLKLWGNNRAAKLLMPLLSKEKKMVAMERVEVEARKQGIEVPSILTDIDTKTGMPKLLQIVEDKNSEEAPAQLEEMVQKQVSEDDIATRISNYRFCWTRRLLFRCISRMMNKFKRTQ